MIVASPPQPTRFSPLATDTVVRAAAPLQRQAVVPRLRWAVAAVHCGAVLFVVLVCGTPTAANAHYTPPQAQLILQIDKQGLVGLWRVELGGPMAEVLRRTYDRNADGVLDKSERSALSARVLQRAIGAVEMHLGSVTAAEPPTQRSSAIVLISPQQFDVQVSASGGQLTAIMLGRLGNTRPLPGATIFLRCHNEIALRLHGRDGFALRRASTPVDHGASIDTSQGPDAPVSFALSPGMEVTLQVRQHERKNSRRQSPGERNP